MTYSRYFTTRKRTDLETWFVCLKDEAPEELRDFVQAVHFGDDFNRSLPNDWIYKTISEAFEELEDNGNDLDAIEIQADVYYKDLYEWFAHGFADDFCNHAIDELGPFESIWDIMGSGQYLAKQQIYADVSEFLNNNKEEKEDEE